MIISFLSPIKQPISDTLTNPLSNPPHQHSPARLIQPKHRPIMRLVPRRPTARLPRIIHHPLLPVTTHQRKTRLTKLNPHPILQVTRKQQIHMVRRQSLPPPKSSVLVRILTPIHQLPLSIQAPLQLKPVQLHNRQLLTLTSPTHNQQHIPLHSLHSSYKRIKPHIISISSDKSDKSDPSDKSSILIHLPHQPISLRSQFLITHLIISAHLLLDMLGHVS